MKILFDSDAGTHSSVQRFAPHYRVDACRVNFDEEPKTQEFQVFALVMAFKAYFLPVTAIKKVLNWESERLARAPGAKHRGLFLASHEGRSLVVLDLQSALIGPRDLPRSGYVLCSTWDPGFALWVDRLGELCEVSRDRFDRPSQLDSWIDGEDEVGASLLRSEILLGTRVLSQLC